MCILDEIRAKSDEIYAIARKHKRCNPREATKAICNAAKRSSWKFGIIALSMMERTGIAYLSNEGKYSSFSYQGDVIRFMTSPRLVRYTKVTKWDNGYIEVIARYGDRDEEEFVDLVPILENLCIAPDEFLKPIKNVEVSYA